MLTQNQLLQMRETVNNAINKIKAVNEAVHNEGPEPKLHREIMKRHREEWPTLWDAIDRLLE